jgi:riboflavin synthase
MFTGLIESVGRIAAVEPTASGRRLRVTTDIAGELTPGESVAVNGVCLTVTTTADGEMHADIGPETARVTTLGELVPMRPVNLERSMRADSRFGGHFVQGHVDGTGTVLAIREDGDAHWLSIAFPAELAAYLVAKGSIAVDGISLTVAQLEEDWFDLMIIPFTWEHTAVAFLRAGERVNLECDMVGKYVARGVELAAARLAALQHKR